jgi:hypothetical protein
MTGSNTSTSIIMSNISLAFALVEARPPRHFSINGVNSGAIYLKG